MHEICCHPHWLASQSLARAYACWRKFFPRRSLLTSCASHAGDVAEDDDEPEIVNMKLEARPSQQPSASAVQERLYSSSSPHAAPALEGEQGPEDAKSQPVAGAEKRLLPGSGQVSHLAFNLKAFRTAHCLSFLFHSARLRSCTHPQEAQGRRQQACTLLDDNPAVDHSIVWPISKLTEAGD